MDQQITSRNDADDVTEVTQAPEPPAAATPQPTVEVLPGLLMGVSEVIALHNRDCRKCTGGWVSFVMPDGGRRRAICECALQKAKRRLHAAKVRHFHAPDPAAPAPAPARETARAHERIRRLGAELEAMSGKLAERTKLYEQETAPVEAELRADRARLADVEAEEVGAQAQIDRLAAEIAEAEKRIEILRQWQDRARANIVEAQHMKAALVGEISRSEALLAHEKSRFEVGAERIRRDMAKLERRITAVRIYNPDVSSTSEAVACAP